MKTVTDRTRRLAQDYAAGLLPEQAGQGPLTRWCPECRTDLGGFRHYRSGIAKVDKCKKCNGTGIIRPT